MLLDRQITQKNLDRLIKDNNLNELKEGKLLRKIVDLYSRHLYAKYVHQNPRCTNNPDFRLNNHRLSVLMDVSDKTIYRWEKKLLELNFLSKITYTKHVSRETRKGNGKWMHYTMEMPVTNRHTNYSVIISDKIITYQVTQTPEPNFYVDNRSFSVEKPKKQQQIDKNSNVSNSLLLLTLSEKMSTNNTRFTRYTRYNSVDKSTQKGLQILTLKLLRNCPPYATHTHDSRKANQEVTRKANKRRRKQSESVNLGPAPPPFDKRHYLIEQMRKDAGKLSEKEFNEKYK